MENILIVAFFFSFVLNLRAQSIYGQVANSDKEPLAFASITVLDAESNIIQVEYTDQKGRYELHLEPGSYEARIEFLSYQTQNLPPFDIHDKSIDLGTTFLIPLSLDLEEIIVESKRNQVQNSIDKRIYNVDSDIVSKAGSAAEILNNLPSVYVDIEGTVSLRGSRNVRILINGKPSGLIGLDGVSGLANIQASMIDKVEIITNPGAKYEAQGEAGIINIVLKKQKKHGFQGTFHGNTAWPLRLMAGANLNYRKDRFNIFSNLAYSFFDSPGFGRDFQINRINTDIFKFESTRDMQRQGESFNFQFGTEYFIDNMSTLTASGLYKKSFNENSTRIHYTDFDGNDVLISETERTDLEDENSKDIEINLNFVKKFDKEDRKFSLEFQYGVNDETEISQYRESILEINNDVFQRSTNTQDQQTHLFQSDYHFPISESSNFEVGIRYSFRNVSNDFTVEEQEDALNWKILENFDDELVYDEGIYAAYMSYIKKIEKISIQTGIRAEYSDIKTLLVESLAEKQRNYLDLFPSIHFSYHLNTNDQLRVSYSRRINRPRFWFLMPFLTYSDSRIRFQGNPDLQPEYTDSYELGYMKFLEKGSISTSLYYRYRKGLVEFLRSVNEETGTTDLFPFNLSTEHSFGLEWSMNYDLSDWCSFNTNFNFYRSYRTGSFKGNILDARVLTMNNRSSIKFNIAEIIELQTSLNYRAPENTTQGKRLSISNWDLGASKEIFEKKGNVSLSIIDILNNRISRSRVDIPEQYAERVFQWRRGQSFRINLEYRLNKKKQKANIPNSRGPSL